MWGGDPGGPGSEALQFCFTEARIAFEIHQDLSASPQTDPPFIWTVCFSLQKITFLSQQLLECRPRNTVQWAGPPLSIDANGHPEATSGPKNSLRLTQSHSGPYSFQGLPLYIDFVWEGSIFLCKKEISILSCFFLPSKAT